MAARLASSGTAIIRSTRSGTNEGSTRGRPMPSMQEDGAFDRGHPAIGAVPVEHRRSGIDHAQPRRQPPVADEAADRGRGPAGAGAARPPKRARGALQPHLGEDRFGDVVVAAPVRRPLGIGELVEVVAAGLGGEPPALGVDPRGSSTKWQRPPWNSILATLSAEVAARHHRHERQAQQPGEIGLGNRGRARGGLDERRPRPDPAVAQPVEEQRARQPVLQAAGGVGRLVLQVQVDPRCAGSSTRIRWVSAERAKSASIRAIAS